MANVEAHASHCRIWHGHNRYTVRYGICLAVPTFCPLPIVSELCPQDAAVRCSGTCVVTQNDMDDGEIRGEGKVRFVDHKGSPKVAKDEVRIGLAGTASVSLGQCLSSMFWLWANPGSELPNRQSPFVVADVHMVFTPRCEHIVIATGASYPISKAVVFSPLPLSLRFQRSNYSHCNITVFRSAITC